MYYPIEKFNRMIKYNNLMYDNAISASLCLLTIRKFRKYECGLLGMVPMDVVKIIAKIIKSSYIEDIWRESYENNKPKPNIVFRLFGYLF